MKRIFLGPDPVNTPLRTDRLIQWITSGLRQIETASQEDLVSILEGYSYTGTLTETRELDLASPSAANVAAVFATFMNDVKTRGQKRRREE